MEHVDESLAREAPASAAVKRGRGRPRKATPSVPTAPLEVGAAQEPQQDRDHVSRAFHTIATDSLVTGAAVQTTTQADVSTSASSNQDQPLVQSKRGRGRPRKSTKALPVDEQVRAPDERSPLPSPLPSSVAVSTCADIAQKRGRGRPRKAPLAGCYINDQPHEQRSPRKAVIYVQLTPSPRKRLPPSRSVAQASFSGLLTPTTAKFKAPAYADILKFMNGGTVTADYIRKHLPPRIVRRSVTLWEPSSADDVNRVDQRLTVMRYYREVMFAVARSLCEDDDSAIASLRCFAMWLVPDPANRAHKTMMMSCLRAIAAAKTRTPELCAVRATLCGSFSYQELRNLIPRSDAKLCRSTYVRSRRDFVTLLEHGVLAKPRRSRRRFHHAVVDEAINHVLAYDNVSYLSWGTKKIKLNNKSHDVPSILLKKPVSVLYNEYEKLHPEKKRRVSRASFFRLCSVMTNGEVQARKAVDYVTGLLVHDPFESLRDIINRTIPSQGRSLHAKLDVVEAWLKYGHARSATTTCPRHDAVFGLEKKSPVSACNKRQVSCRECLSFYRLFKLIKEQVKTSNPHESAVRVIDDIQMKLELFMGHRVRVVNQQREIASMIQAAQQECHEKGESDVAVVLIDFKMKAEPRYFREKTADHYGKRGMTWHGVQIRTWQVHQGTTQHGIEGQGANQTGADRPGTSESDANQLDADQRSERVVQEVVTYYDHLSCGDNKQDQGAVLSLLEAIIMAIQRDLPNVKRIIVQSDNASSYQNSAVILLLPVLGYVHGLRVVRYEHTETQDGKSPLDGHFGQAGQKVNRHVKQGNNCITPSQYVVALRSDGELPNSVAELVQYDRLGVNALLEQTSSLRTALGKLVGRANDIFYHFPDISHDPKKPFQFEKCPEFEICYYAYSGIGEGARVRVCPSKMECSRRDSEEASSDDNTGTHHVPSDDECSDDEDDWVDCVDLHSARVEEQPESEMATHQSTDSLVGRLTGVAIAKSAQLARKARK